MNRLITICLLPAIALGAFCKDATPTPHLKVSGLTCEYLTDPLSVEARHPRLAWKITDDRHSRHNLTQTAYRIIVASSPEKLQAGEADIWDSGKIESPQSAQVEYNGTDPGSHTRCYWKVRVWNNRGEMSDWSTPAMWGTGLRQWEAGWIGDTPDTALREYTGYVGAHHADSDFDTWRWENPPVLPSPLLRRQFSVPSEIKRATLYASAIGYYEIWINGHRIGDRLQAPEWTDYSDHVQYQTYDVTTHMTQGDNAICATLADGWALGRLAGVKWMRSFPHRGFYAQDRRLIAQLHIELNDGSTIVIPTDSSWKINREGYICCADNFAGQTTDATMIPQGWQSAGFDDSGWDHAYADTTVHTTLVPQPNEPIKAHATLSPVRIWKRRDKFMIDFGQNIAGHCLLHIKGEKGDTLTLRHGEWLNDDGSLYTQSLGYAKATDRFILSGGDDTFEPTFTYHGFQYAELSGMKGELLPEMISAVAVSSSTPQAGTFRCSDGKLNKLFDNIMWTQRNNMFSVLTDNPSRDERTGAMGDIQIFAQTAIFNSGMGAFLTKYLYDMKDTAPNGQFMSMIPSLRHKGYWDGWIGAPGWCEAAFIIPWRMYENYGDIRALEVLYDEMKTHIDATVRENPGLIWKVRHNHNGDWLNANTIASPPDPDFDTTRGATPDDLFATAFLAYSTRLLSDIARVLHRGEDQAKYATLADSITAEFNRAFVSPDGKVEGDTQGAYSISLFYGLIPDDMREKSFAHLLRCIEEYDYRISTGFISTPMMMQLLVDFGRADVAYRLLMSTRFPSWLYIVNNGATTVWERWDAWIPGRGFQNPAMNSLDHVAFGAVAEWMYRNILGINPDPDAPGYAHFTLRPLPGGGLTWAEGSYDSIKGEIKSSWKKEKGRTTYSFTIPANTRATVILPDCTTSDVSCMTPLSIRLPEFKSTGAGSAAAELGSGDYTFVVAGGKR